jgi:hypothetical protein
VTSCISHRAISICDAPQVDAAFIVQGSKLLELGQHRHVPSESLTALIPLAISAVPAWVNWVLFTRVAVAKVVTPNIDMQAN